MEKIKVKFINQWTGNDAPPPCSILGSYLFNNYEVIIDENPDYVITQAFIKEPLGKYNDKIVIFETGEAVVPDFNLVDYAIGYDNIIFGDRYYQFPYHLFTWEEKTCERVDMIPFIDRKFCNFIYSNPDAHPLRDQFYHFLSDYKKIDSYGQHMNNMQMPASRDNEDWQGIKLEIQAKYKFTIAFENAAHDGYTTEKICDAFQAGTIPIYFGNPNVDKLFNVDSFIWIKSKDDFSKALEKIIQIENDEEKFTEMIYCPKLLSDLEVKKRDLEVFLDSIFKRNLSVARRKGLGTFQEKYSNENIEHQNKIENYNNFIYLFRLGIAVLVRSFIIKCVAWKNWFKGFFNGK